jgi:hypothetical protein
VIRSVLNGIGSGSGKKQTRMGLCKGEQRSGLAQVYKIGMSMERYFQLEREFQLCSRMIATANGTIESRLQDLRTSIIGEARVIIRQYDLTTPDWCMEL